ncbi:MAG TPA: histidine phosphatase family protein [Mobilitalea sp.]|nr:histidine phosphatase family protein [Mobilitalea sp.]
MNIYLIRHGETDWNLEGRLQGREDIPLNQNGMQQAKYCGRAFKNREIKKIITSPLIRAVKTAEIIAESIGISQVLLDERLIERDFGPLAGLTYDKKKHFDTFGKEEGIEPWEELNKRLIDCIIEQAEANLGEDIIMVSHGGAINAVVSVLTGGEMGSGKTRLKNSCISIIQYDDGKLNLDVYNLSPSEFVARM